VEGSCEGEEASLAEFVEHGAYVCQMCCRRKWEKLVMEKEVDDGEEQHDDGLGKIDAQRKLFGAISVEIKTFSIAI